MLFGFGGDCEGAIKTGCDMVCLCGKVICPWHKPKKTNLAPGILVPCERRVLSSESRHINTPCEGFINKKKPAMRSMG